MDFSSALFDSIAKGDENAMIHVNDVLKLIHTKDDNGCTALHWAALNESSEKLVSKLIELGADVDATDHYGRYSMSRIIVMICLNKYQSMTCLL